MELVIRQAEITDVDKMYAISCRAHQKYGTLIPEAHRSRFLRYYDVANEKHKRKYDIEITDHIQSPDWNVSVATVGGEVVGYTLAQHEGAAVHKKGLFVDPEYQGRGIGEELFRHSINYVNGKGNIDLLVISTNAKAIHLYEKYGFKMVNVECVTFYGAKQQKMIYQSIDNTSNL